MTHPSELEELLELCGCVFPTSIGSQKLQFVPNFILNKGFPFMERVEVLTLLLQDLHPRVVCVVINECEEVLSSTK